MTLQEQALYYHECYLSLQTAGFDAGSALYLVGQHLAAHTIALAGVTRGD